MLSYAPRPAVVALAWAATALCIGWLVLTPDPAGRVLAVPAIALLGSLAVVGTVVRPRLTADADGVTVGRLRGARRWGWPVVRRLEAVPTRRLGRTVWLLELEADEPDGTERLVVLSRLDLGADPVDIAAALSSLRHPD